MLLFLLSVGAEGETPDEDSGYYGQTVILHNLKLNFKNYNVPEEDPRSVVIIENKTAHDAYEGRRCATVQYYCNKTGMMSTKLQEETLPKYWNDSKYYGGKVQFMKNTSY